MVKRGILYAPYFVINAGGLLNISSEVNHRDYQATWTRDRVDNLYELLISVFEQARQTGHSPHQVAAEMGDYFLHEPLKKAM